MMAVCLGDSRASAFNGVFGSSWTHELTADPKFSLRATEGGANGKQIACPMGGGASSQASTGSRHAIVAIAIDVTRPIFGIKTSGACDERPCKSLLQAGDVAAENERLKKEALCG